MREVKGKMGEMKRLIYRGKRERKRYSFSSLLDSPRGNVLWLRVNVLRVNTMMMKKIKK